MKKLILFVMLFATLGLQTVSAQKWARKLGLAVAEKVNPTQNVVSEKNTNADNIVCSNQDMSFKLRKCVRMGNKVAITATLMNNSGKEIKFYPLDSKTIIYDSDGETYKQDIDASKLANTYWSNVQRVTIPVGVPVKATFVIQDVPATVKEFSIAKFVYQLWNPNGDNTEHYFEIRNQAISEK